MTSAQIFAGAAKGFGKAADYAAGAEERASNRKTASMRQEAASIELKEYKSNAPTRKREDELKLQQLEAQTQGINAQSTKQQTMDAFRLFDNDKDTRHLNTWLENVKKNPVGANLYGDVVRVDSLFKSTENDKLLRKMGYTDLEGVYNDPDLSKDLVLFTGTNSNQRGLININDMYAGTGFTNYMDNEKLAKMETKARINKMMRTGMSSGKAGLRERVAQAMINAGDADDLADAYEKVLAMETKDVGSTEERQIAAIMEEDETLTRLEALDKYYKAKRQDTGVTNEERYVQEYMDNNAGSSREEATSNYRNLKKTNVQKHSKDIDALRKSLDNMNWLDTSISDMTKTDRSKMYRDYIGPLEDLRGFKLNTEEKRKIRDLRNLTALGHTAGSELTPEETGLLDSTLEDFKKYMFDEVGGKVGTAAYETFRNVFRNALYGQALTPSETKTFNKAAGTLGQKFRPVMAQLKTQMTTIKKNLESIRDLNDPDIAHYYTGQSIEEIDRAIEEIDRRIKDPSLVARQPVAKKIMLSKKTPEELNKPKFDIDAAMDEAEL